MTPLNGYTLVANYSNILVGSYYIRKCSRRTIKGKRYDDFEYNLSEENNYGQVVTMVVLEVMSKSNHNIMVKTHHFTPPTKKRTGWRQVTSLTFRCKKIRNNNHPTQADKWEIKSKPRNFNFDFGWCFKLPNSKFRKLFDEVTYRRTETKD